MIFNIVSAILIITPSQICFDYIVVVLNLLRLSIGDLAAEVDHRNILGDSHYQLHIVLYQKNRQMVGVTNFADGFHQFLFLLGVHACSRLVKKQKLRRGREGASDLQKTLMAVGDIAGLQVLHPFQSQETQDFQGFLTGFLFLSAAFAGLENYVEHTGFCLAVKSGHYIFKNGS